MEDTCDIQKLGACSVPSIERHGVTKNNPQKNLLVEVAAQLLFEDCPLACSDLFLAGRNSNKSRSCLKDAFASAQPTSGSMEHAQRSQFYSAPNRI